MAESVVDLRDVLRGLRVLDEAAARDAALFWREARVEAKEEIRSHRRGLARRDRDTVASHGRGPILGKVITAYRVFANASGLEFDSLVPYSAVLDEGGRVGHNAVLPPRRYAFWGDAFVARIAGRYAAFIGARFA